MTAYRSGDLVDSVGGARQERGFLPGWIRPVPMQPDWRARSGRTIARAPGGVKNFVGEGGQNPIFRSHRQQTPQLGRLKDA